MNKTKKVISWILRIIISLGFLFASLGKLTNNPQVIEMFENWGYPGGFHFLIGILELAVAILVLIPKTLKIAIYGIVILMIGAAATHIINDPLLELIRPLIFFVLIGSIYFINFYKTT